MSNKKTNANNIREYIIKDKLGVGSFGTVYRVFKKGNYYIFYLLTFVFNSISFR